MALTSEERLSRLVGAMKHPLRRNLLRLVHQSSAPISPKELSQATQMPLSDVSYHVRVLVDAETLTLKRTMSVRGSEQHFYASNEEMLGEPIVQAALAQE